MGNKTGKKSYSSHTRRHPNTSQASASPIETITELNRSIEVIDKREHFLGKKIIMYRKIARQKHRAGKTKVALNNLRRSKIYEKEVEKINNIRISLQQQIINLESSHMNIQTIEVMKEGQKAMKSMSEKTTIEEVEKLHEDIEEHHQTNQEIGEILAQPMGNSEWIDEEELEQEYNDLIADELTEDLTTISPPQLATITAKISQIAKLPTPPTYDPTQEVNTQDINAEEQEELEALGALAKSMAV